MKTTKITLSTVKSFIKKNRENLFINVKSSFDGMTDCVESLKGGFTKAESDKTESKSIDYNEATQGIKGAWFVRGSRDYFTPFENSEFTGIEVSNCCGSFILAVKKEPELSPIDIENINLKDSLKLAYSVKDSLSTEFKKLATQRNELLEALSTCYNWAKNGSKHDLIVFADALATIYKCDPKTELISK